MFDFLFQVEGHNMSEDKSISINEELQKWINETKKDIKTTKKTSKRKPSGKCQICGEKTAEVVCLKCGRSVCGSCYFKIIGICKKCVPKEIAEKWEGKHPDWEKVLGVEWVD